MPLLSSCHDFHRLIIIEENSDELEASTFTPTGYNMRSPRARHENPRKGYNQISSQSRGNHGLWLNDFEGSRCGEERLRDYCIMREMNPLPLRIPSTQTEKPVACSMRRNADDRSCHLES